MEYVSARIFAQTHNISVRWVQELCRTGRISGAMRLGGNGAWIIPENASISNNVQVSNDFMSNSKKVFIWLMRKNKWKKENGGKLK